MLWLRSSQKKWLSSKCKNVTIINLRISHKPVAHLQTDKTHVKFPKYADEIRSFRSQDWTKLIRQTDIWTHGKKQYVSRPGGDEIRGTLINALGICLNKITPLKTSRSLTNLWFTVCHPKRQSGTGARKRCLGFCK